VAQGVVNDANIIGIVGPAFSGATAASEVYYAPANLPIISPSATRVSLASHGWSNFHRVVADDGIQGPADADYAVKKLKATKIYVADDASSYGSGLASAFAAQAKMDGATVTSATVPGTTQCQAGTGDSSQYAAAATAVVASKATLFFYGGYYCDLGLFTGALHTAGFKGTIFSGDGSLDPGYINGTTPASATAGAIASCACATVTDAKFIAGFTALAKFAPGTYSAEAYDAANALIAAIKATKTVTRANVNATINAKGFSYKGLTKTIAFQANGNISGSAIYVNKVVCTAKGCAFVQQGLE
jgi:branched-chain amino acid transport system substrate-binding protein